jgi:ubiquinol-cytochrome c reductase iron-sulfur subunit
MPLVRIADFRVSPQQRHNHSISMNDREKIDKTRRTLLVATSVAGGAATVAAAVPFVASMMPSERARAAGAPVEAEIATMQPGELRVFEWRGKPVWVIRRSKEMLDSLKAVVPNLTDPESKASEQPDYAKNEFRSMKPEIMVMEGVCTHLGCSPQLKPAEARAEMGADWVGGFYCPCHGSKFDYAGRVFRGAPAPTNLSVPPYTFVSDAQLLIGEDKDKKGA